MFFDNFWQKWVFYTLFKFRLNCQRKSYFFWCVQYSSALKVWPNKVHTKQSKQMSTQKFCTLVIHLTCTKSYETTEETWDPVIAILLRNGKKGIFLGRKCCLTPKMRRQTTKFSNTGTTSSKKFSLKTTLKSVNYIFLSKLPKRHLFGPKMTSYDKNETSHAKKFLKIFNMSRGTTFSLTV